MNKVWKVIIGIAVVVLVVVGVTAYNKKNAVPTEKQTIKIGYVAPLTGNVAFIGTGVKNAAELALEDLKKKDTKYNYELVFEDDAFDPKRTATAVNKLVSVDKVNAFVSVASSAGGVAGPIAEQDKVVHFSIAGDQTIAKGTYNFLNWTPPVEEVKLFIAEAQKRGIKKLAVFDQKQSGITAVIDELKAQLPGTGISIVFEDISNFGTKDFRTTLTKAKATDADYYLLVMFSPEIEIVTNQIRELGITTPLTAIESFELADNPKLFEGLWYVNGADPTPAFAAAYTEKYKHDPTIATPNAYDIVGLIAAAAETFDGKTVPTEEQLANALLNVKGYDGALGKNLSINPDGLVISKAVLRTIKDGKPQTIK
jgi:branched-chain amino acid transport system substrate-binding protein